MSMSSLDRLHNLQKSQPVEETSSYNLEESIRAASEDDAQFIQEMSEEARDGFMGTVAKEVTLDDEEEDLTPPEEDSPIPPAPEAKNDLFNNNKKVRKTYSRKDATASGEWDVVLNQLSKDIIKDLIENGYTVGNFDKATTKKILKYMFSKF